ncbi:MAG: hypothetical protein FWH07_05640 [Oscillospiraceae bacterium]|nr:hypothetical protein [Oscillospiraceae bacterium]
MVDIDKWNAMPTHVKFLNIGSEINRTINLYEKKSPYVHGSFDRALELIDATLKPSLGFGGIWELCRVRELLCALVFQDNTDNNAALKRYFDTFALKKNY